MCEDGDRTLTGVAIVPATRLFPHNLELSQKRAEAVVQALTSTYHVAPARLAAKGIASLSPVASNSEDAGRAQNRRVELVQQ